MWKSLVFIISFLACNSIFKYLRGTEKECKSIGFFDEKLTITDFLNVSFFLITLDT